MSFANHDGVRLYWRLDGAEDRPVLLLLNSLGTDMSLWDRAAVHLLGQFRLLRMDVRGHGASDAPAGDYRLDELARDALAVMDAAQVQRATVCGISLGGMIAITHPELCVSVLTGLLAMNADGYAGCGAAVRDMDLIGRIGAIRMPVLLISAKRDISMPFSSHGERILAALGGARHVSLDAAHLACVEAPGAFAAAVRGFVSEVLSGSEARAAQEVLLQAGMQTRREVLGEQWVERTLATRTPFNAEFQ
ncbi:MAG: alpha/beta fold hydrolase, partial [Steroidobacteraceae bacterium]